MSEWPAESVGVVGTDTCGDCVSTEVESVGVCRGSGDVRVGIGTDVVCEVSVVGVYD